MEPQCVNPNTGQVYRCEHCNAPLFRFEATSQRKRPCCDGGRLVRLGLRVPQPPPPMLEQISGRKWPRLCKPINSACTFASLCVRRDYAAGGKGFHHRGNSDSNFPSLSCLEGIAIYFAQTEEGSGAYTGRDAITTLTQASKQWWVFNKDLPATVHPDLPELIHNTQAALRRCHPLAKGANIGDTIAALAARGPQLRLVLPSQPDTTEVHAVHGNSGAGADADVPPEVEYVDREGKQLLPGAWDLAAFPGVWQEQPYNIAWRKGSGITRRQWARFVYYQQPVQLTRAPTLAQEYALSLISEIANFELAAVREKKTEFRRAHVADVRGSNDPERAARTIEAMPAAYTGALF